MSAAVALIKFIALLAPELRAIAVKLYERHNGNVEAAKAELRYIGDHGQQLKNFEAEIAKRMAELKEKSALREAPRTEPAAAPTTPTAVPTTDPKP